MNRRDAPPAGWLYEIPDPAPVLEALGGVEGAALRGRAEALMDRAIADGRQTALLYGCMSALTTQAVAGGDFERAAVLDGAAAELAAAAGAKHSTLPAYDDDRFWFSPAALSFAEADGARAVLRGRGGWSAFWAVHDAGGADAGGVESRRLWREYKAYLNHGDQGEAQR